MQPWVRATCAQTRTEATPGLPVSARECLGGPSGRRAVSKLSMLSTFELIVRASRRATRAFSDGVYLSERGVGAQPPGRYSGKGRGVGRLARSAPPSRRAWCSANGCRPTARCVSIALAGVFSTGEHARPGRLRPFAQSASADSEWEVTRGSLDPALQRYRIAPVAASPGRNCFQEYPVQRSNPRPNSLNTCRIREHAKPPAAVSSRTQRHPQRRAAWALSPPSRPNATCHRHRTRAPVPWVPPGDTAMTAQVLLVTYSGRPNFFW